MALSFGTPELRGHDAFGDVPPSRLEALFGELDGRLVDGSWVVEVLGIHTTSDDLWVQVAPPSIEPQGVVLHLKPGATADHTFAALRAWSRLAIDHRPRIIEVVPFVEPSDAASSMAERTVVARAIGQ